MFLFNCYSRGSKVYQVVKETEVDYSSADVTLRDIDTGRIVSKPKRTSNFEGRPIGYLEYDFLNFGRYPIYLLVAPRDTWASQFQCPVHGICTDAMVTTKKSCAIPAKNGQCNEILIRGKATSLGNY